MGEKLTGNWPLTQNGVPPDHSEQMYVSDGMSASRLLCLPLSWVAMVTSTSLLAFFLYASVPFSPTYTLPLSILHKPLTCMNAETL